jgi:hypothetical protein
VSVIQNDRFQFHDCSRKNCRGKESVVFLDECFVTFHFFFQDYLVMLPQEYYKATHVRQRVEEPCLVDTKSEFCVDYRYLTVSSPDAVNVTTALGQLVGARTLLPYAPFQSYSVLNPLVTCFI